MRKQYERVVGAVAVAMCLLIASRATAGSLNPTNAPGPTMHTLEEIYQKLQSLDPETQQLLSPTTAAVNGGYYSATNLAQVDADLTAANIATNVTLFGIAGTLSTNIVALIQKTGQTTVYRSGDDGTYQKGMASSIPRFTIQSDPNCVLDNMTGLIWARNANMGGAMTWSDAIDYCESLNYGGQTDWRLPNAKELLSLIDLECADPPLSAGHPFTGVLSLLYWSSSTYKPGTGAAWWVSLAGGSSAVDDKPNTQYVWPVRGGQ